MNKKWSLESVVLLLRFRQPAFSLLFVCVKKVRLSLTQSKLLSES